MSLQTEKTDLDAILTATNDIDVVVSGIRTTIQDNKSFIYKNTFTRPTNTTLYTIGDSITDLTNELKVFHFGVGYANRKIKIESVTLFSNKTSSNITFKLLFYRTTDLDYSSFNVGDNEPFTPKYDDEVNYYQCCVENISTAIIDSVDKHAIQKTDFSRIITINSVGDVFYAIVVTNAYQPIADEYFHLIVTGSYL